MIADHGASHRANTVRRLCKYERRHFNYFSYTLERATATTTLCKGALVECSRSRPFEFDLLRDSLPTIARASTTHQMRTSGARTQQAEPQGLTNQTKSMSTSSSLYCSSCLPHVFQSTLLPILTPILRPQAILRRILRLNLQPILRPSFDLVFNHTSAYPSTYSSTHSSAYPSMYSSIIRPILRISFHSPFAMSARRSKPPRIKRALLGTSALFTLLRAPSLG